MKRYVVCLLLDNDLRSAFFILRKKQPFAGYLNGFGGKIEQTESIHQAMMRELSEETGLGAGNLQKVEYLMTIHYPSAIELNVFYAILKRDAEPNYRINEEGIIGRCQINDRMLAANNPDYAGDGNIAYWLNCVLGKEGAELSRPSVE